MAVGPSFSPDRRSDVPVTLESYPGNAARFCERSRKSFVREGEKGEKGDKREIKAKSTSKYRETNKILPSVSMILITVYGLILLTVISTRGAIKKVKVGILSQYNTILQSG